MSHIDLGALSTAFTNWKRDRMPTAPDDKAFERFSIELVLKDYEPSDEDISSGMCGATDDGGADAIYFYAGRRLITPDIDVPDEASTATLIIVQASHGAGGFSETRIERFETFMRDMLDYQTAPQNITHLNLKARELIANFRHKYQGMATRAHSLHVLFYYCAKTNVAPDKNTKITTRYKRLERYVKSNLTAASVDLNLWNASVLLRRFREQPQQRVTVEITRHFTTTHGDVVCLCLLRDFYNFLKGKDGQLRTNMLEPNVRDYQGKRNKVNTAIRKTLESRLDTEFWWLNNGITVLGSEPTISGNHLAVKTPEIVNGLQTSYEIFTFFSEQPTLLKTESRSILLRIIVPPDEKVSSVITKATNFQTEVTGISLHATEDIHFDIEDKLLVLGLFYDRKKGKYAKLKKPVVDIVSVVELARAVIAILLRRPDDARARPQTLLANDDTYVQIFDRRYPTDLYASCILLDRAVNGYLQQLSKAEPEEKRDIRYYVDMWLCCELLSASEPTAEDIARSLGKCKAIDNMLLEAACKKVLQKYRAAGGTDKVAKGSEFAPALQRSLNRKFARKKI